MSATDRAPAHPAPAGSGEASPRDRATIARLVSAHMETRVVAAAVQLGVPDAIGDAERTADEVAAAVAAEPGTTRRLLRALASLGLLTHTSTDAFALTPVGALLRTGRPETMRDFAAMCTDAAMLDAWRGLGTAVRTGRRAFDVAFGTDFFAHLRTDPVLSGLFNSAMRQSAHAAAQILPGAFDFARFDTVADVGGGDGTLLAAILRAHGGLRGLVYDTAEGSAAAAATLAAAGVAQRATTVTGDFFRAVPAGAEVYLLKSVLHDWDDEQVVAILRHCRVAVPPHGRLLIVEPVLPDVAECTPTSALMHLGDLNMLVNLGGRERTRHDFATVCAAAGFELADVTPLAPARFSLIEAVPVATPADPA